MPAAYYMKMKIDRPKLHRIYRYLIDWLYPNICPCCKKTIPYNADFCEDCKRQIKRYSGNTQIPYTDGFAAYCVYEGIIRQAVLEFKKVPDGNTYYAFACGIFSALSESGLSGGIDMIVPVPVSGRTMSERGYNQTELIAKELRYLLNIPYKNALIKTRETKMQKSIRNAADRRENVADAFSVSPKAGAIAGKSILLIDDLCTTGSTLENAAKALKKAGAERIIAAAFAKTLNKKGS